MATMNTYFETNTHRHWLIDEKKTSWTLNAVSGASIQYTNAQFTLHTEKLRRLFHHPGIASGNLTLDHEKAQVRTTLYHTLSRGGRWWHWCGSHQVFRTRIEPTIRPGCRRWDRRRRTRGGHERNDCKWWCHLWYIHHEPSTCFPHWMIDRNERSDDDGKMWAKMLLRWYTSNQFLWFVVHIDYSVLMLPWCNCSSRRVIIVYQTNLVRPWTVVIFGNFTYITWNIHKNMSQAAGR